MCRCVVDLPVSMCTPHRLVVTVVLGWVGPRVQDTPATVAASTHWEAQWDRSCTCVGACTNGMELCLSVGIRETNFPKPAQLPKPEGFYTFYHRPLYAT